MLALLPRIIGNISSGQEINFDHFSRVQNFMINFIEQCYRGKGDKYMIDMVNDLLGDHKQSKIDSQGIQEDFNAFLKMINQHD